MLGKDNEALEALEKSDGLLKDAPIQQARNASLAGVIHFRKGDAQKASGAVMRALAAVQTELAPTIGYDGADGYVQLQVALMEHLADPAVAHATQAATHALCARAGITPPTSPPQ